MMVAAAPMAVMAAAVAIDAGAAAAEDAAPAGETAVEIIGAGDTAPEPAGGVTVESASPVAAAPAAVTASYSCQAPATGVALATAGTMVVEAAAGAATDQADQSAALDVPHTDGGKASAIVAAITCGVPAADVGPATTDVNPVSQGRAVAVGMADDKSQPVAADLVAADDQGVPAMVEVLADVAIDTDEVPAAADNAAGAGGGDAAAVAAVAVAVSETIVAVVAADVAVNADQRTTKDAVPAIQRRASEAEEAVSAAAEAPPLSAEAGGRSRWDRLECCYFMHKILTGIWAVAAFFALLEV